MTTIKKIGKEYYIVRSTKIREPKAWFRGGAKGKGYSGGTINLGCVYIPFEFVGKKLRIKVEVIEDITKEKDFLRGEEV